MLSTRSGKSFICSLHNSLAADVDPRAGCHLPVHRQAHSLEAIELRVVVPLADKICVRDEDAWCFIVCPEFAHRFARLDEQRLVILELAQRANNRVERLPTSGSAARSAVDDQLFRILSDIRIEIVHQHPHCGFLVPSFAGALATARRMHDSFPAHDFSPSLSKSPCRIVSATRAISSESGRSCTSGDAILRIAACARSTPTPAFNGLRCSKPSAAVSSSIASKFSARSTTERSFSALVIPMET